MVGVMSVLVPTVSLTVSTRGRKTPIRTVKNPGRRLPTGGGTQLFGFISFPKSHRQILGKRIVLADRETRESRGEEYRFSCFSLMSRYRDRDTVFLMCSSQ